MENISISLVLFAVLLITSAKAEIKTLEPVNSRNNSAVTSERSYNLLKRTKFSLVQLNSFNSTALDNDISIAATENYETPTDQHNLQEKPKPTPPKEPKQPTFQTFPQNLVDRFPELTTLNRRSTTSTMKKKSPTTEGYVKPITVLEYKPITSSFLPHPVTVGQIIPPGKPWPASGEEHQTTTLSPTTTTQKIQTIPEFISTKPDDDVQPITILEYKPIAPSFLPSVTVGPIISPGTSWPASADKNQTSISFPTTTPKIPSTTNELINTQPNDYVEPITILNYKPIAPSFLPHPVTVGTIISPGTPWPASADKNHSSNTSPTTTEVINTTKPNDYVEPITILEYSPILPSFLPNPVTVGPLIPPGKPWPATAEELETTKLPQPQSTTSKGTSTTIRLDSTETSYVEPITVLSYKPITSFYVPRPVTLGEIIPTGKPWPASASEKPKSTKKPQGFSEITTSIVEDQTTKTQFPRKNFTNTPDTKTSYVQSITILSYKPITSFYVPRPVTVGQIISPGTPWPASATTKKPFTTRLPPKLDNRFPEITTASIESQTVSVTPSHVSQKIPSKKPLLTTLMPSNSSQTLSPNLSERFPELTDLLSTTKKAGNKIPTKKPQSTSTTSRLVLTYKPQRPWYQPRPSGTGQLVPPGKPWPSSDEEDAFATVTMQPSALLKESIGHENAGPSHLPHSKEDELQTLKEEVNLLEPNALQYYGSRITAPHRHSSTSAAPPFTSGTQKSTIFDITDILKETHNMTSGKVPPSPSHLLPYDDIEAFLQTDSQPPLPMKPHVVRNHENKSSSQNAQSRQKVFTSYTLDERFW